MKAYQRLPEGYGQIREINLQKDKKTAAAVNGWAVVLMAAVLVTGSFFAPVTAFFDMSSFSGYFMRVFILLIAILVYMVLHELTHAAAMKLAGGGKVIFGFTGLYAFAGSHDDCFDKTAYRCTALAPVVVWGIIFGIMCAFVPDEQAWFPWFMQAANVGGAAGDLYVTLKLWNSPASILVKDTGVDMTVYDKTS